MIDRQEAIDTLESKTYRHTYLDQIVDIIKELPSAQPEIIRCKDCEDYQTDWETSAGFHYCAIIDTNMPPEGFCSKATRKGEQL